MSSDSWDSRTRLLLGDENADRLRAATVMVAGLGGVGGYVAEVLARSGVGNLILIDADDVALSNLNRQIIATHNTVGRPKSEVWRERLLSINPDLHVDARREFITPDNVGLMLQPRPDFVADAIDTVAPKVELMRRCVEQEIPLISSMGAGNKLDASAFRVADIYKTKVCPLAKVMRRELKKRGVKKLKVVYSEEQPIRPIEDMAISCRSHCICPPGAKHKCTERRDIPGSVAFVPSVVGLIIAGEVIKDLTAECRR